MIHPPVRPIRWEDTHRLIPSLYSQDQTILADLAGGRKELEDLVLLDGATNDRVQAEQQGSIGISTYELVYAIPNAHIVNAAYTHPNETGGRFNDNTRGAWYAADRREASIAEVVYHKSRRLSEIVVPEEPAQRPGEDRSTYDDWQANFQGRFHTLDPPADYAELLEPEPVPQCYALSQVLAKRLLAEGSNGLTYPSVRYPGARCLVCFRPALVYHPHRSGRLEITLSANETGYEHRVRELAL